MKNKHKEIVAKLFEVPTRCDINWDDVINLFESLGAVIIQGSGSRIKIVYHGAPVFLHRPHPGKCLKQYMVKNVRQFLQGKEIQP